MSLTSAIIIVGCVVMIAFHYWRRTPDEFHTEAQRLRWFWVWAIKGVGVPGVLWLFFNSGLVFPPVLPAVEAAQNAGRMLRGVIAATTNGAVVIASFWAAVTFLWLLLFMSSRVQSRLHFCIAAFFTSLITFPLAWALVNSEGWVYAGFAGMLWLGPIAHLTLPLTEPAEKPTPNYSEATAKLMFDKYEDAEAAIIRELEKREDDFDGWMMLAELYATHFNDLTAAERTVLETCSQPNVNASQYNVAMHKLADWHLQIGEDPAAARKSLENVCRRFPGTHIDRMARQRLQRTPADREELLAQRGIKVLRLPALRKDLEEDAPGEIEIDRKAAAANANRFVEKLKRNPNDVQAREEFARILAEQLNQVNVAIEQVEMLIALPGQPAQKVAGWLATIAAWQLRYQHDGLAARQTLEWLLREFPNTPQAFAARQRLSIMDLEVKMRQARAPAPDLK